MPSIYLVTVGHPGFDESITLDVAAWNATEACCEALRAAFDEGVVSTHIFRCVRMGGEVAASVSPQGSHHPAEEGQA